MTSRHRTDLVPPRAFLQRVFASEENEAELLRVVRNRVFQPRSDCDVYVLPTPIDWEAADRLVDRNWRMQLQGWNLFNPLLNGFDQLDDKSEALDFFFSVLDDWWSVYGDDPDDIVTSRMPDSYAWYDMSVGCRALVLGFFGNRIEHFDLETTPAQRDLLELAVAKHRRHLRLPEVFSANNHGLFQAHGLMAISRLPYAGPATSDIVRASELMEQLVESQFDEHGVHREHSPHYHFYVLEAFEAALASGWYSSDGVIGRLASARRASKWLVDPHLRCVCVGDSLLAKQPSVQLPTESESLIVSGFEDSGYAIARTGWTTPPSESSMVFLTGGYHSKSHKHRDCLSFEWFDRGERIVCDGGKYGYRSDERRRYALSSRAHNSVEIEGFDVLRLRPYGSVLEPARIEDGILRLGGLLDYPAFTHRRSIHAKPGDWLIVADELQFRREKRFTQWLHLDRRFRLRRVGHRSVHAVADDGQVLYIDAYGDVGDVVVHVGDSDPIQGWTSTRDYEMEPSLAIGFTARSEGADVVTTLALDRSSRLEVAEHARGAGLLGTADVDREELLGDPAPLLPETPHVRVPVMAPIRLDPGRSTYRAPVHGVELEWFAHLKDRDPASVGPRRLLVLIPGASTRREGSVDLQRHGWSDDFSGRDVLAFGDPSLRSTNEIGLAWFQHSAARFGVDALESLLRRLMMANDYAESDVAFFGSSGGGFVSLLLADRFPAAAVVAINPQISLPMYTRRLFLEMLDACYAGLDEDEVHARFADRLSVTLHPDRRRAPTVIFQNRHDERHVQRHVLPFVESLRPDQVHLAELDDDTFETRRVDVRWYDDETAVHSPPDRPITVEWISRVLSQAD